MKTLILSTVIAVGASAALAQDAPTGDAEAGGKVFDRNCTSCHVVKNEAGDTLAGSRARTGPNLYGIAGGEIGTVEGFRYGKGIAKLAEDGATWDEAGFVAYVQDPTGWLREATGDSKARSKMAFKLRKPEDAANVYAYLYSLAN